MEKPSAVATVTELLDKEPSNIMQKRKRHKSESDHEDGVVNDAAVHEPWWTQRWEQHRCDVEFHMCSLA